MPAPVPARLRTVWWTLHRWIALSLCVLLVPIAVSGALLVWKDQFDALIHPARYAVTGNEIAQPLSRYVESAHAALGDDARPVAARLPESGWPVQVQARNGGQLLTVYLDPPTAGVLDTVEFRSSLFGLIHRFHENLTIPAWSGRSINGWAGVGMFILALTGIWLWWPRNGAFLPSLRFQRTPATINNLHHLFGFWISLPLAVVSATGVYLAFPQNARLVMSSMAPMNPPVRSALRSEPAREVKLTPDTALSVALAAQPTARVAAVFMPTVAEGGGRRGGRVQDGERTSSRDAAPSPTWRVQLRKPGGLDLVTILVDDASAAARALPDPLAGDRAAQWVRWLHEGSHSGPVWQVIVFLTGVCPPIFAVTGVLMWLRGRRQRKLLAAEPMIPQGGLQAAE